MFENQAVYWKRFVERGKKIPKSRKTIENFCRMFPNAVMYGKKGYIRKLNPLDWMSEDNFKRKISLWERCGHQRTISYIAIQGRIGQHFVVAPTYQIYTKKGKVEYLWKFKKPIPESMVESVKLLSEAIAYLTPGSKSLHSREDAFVTVPGIPDLHARKAATLRKVGEEYDYKKMWAVVGRYFPVHGHSLRRFLRSEKLYVPGLKTSRQFISLKRLNLMMDMKITLKEFKERKQGILFLLWNFALDIGLKENDSMALIQRFLARRNFSATDDEVYLTRPCKQYKFTNETICGFLGEACRKYFPYKEKKIDAAKIRKQIAGLANNGHTIPEIASVLGMHVSKVKRRRSEAVKMGLIAPI